MKNKIHFRLLPMLSLLLLSALLVLPAFAEGAEEQTEATATSQTQTVQEAVVYIGAVETRADSAWECKTNYAVGASNSDSKSYETMVGNVLRITLYSTIAPADNDSFIVSKDSHISFLSGEENTFTYTGQLGRYYCYQKNVRIAEEGTFFLTVTNSNATLYQGVYDTISITAQGNIDSLDFLVEEIAGEQDTTRFFITANGGSTTLITPDTIGFNATDNEWKFINSNSEEKVLFQDSTYENYQFDPDAISMTLTDSTPAGESGPSIQIYYLGLVNGKLITVGPYLYPPSEGTYSTAFELDEEEIQMLTGDQTATFHAYILSGREPQITVTDTEGVARLVSVEKVPSDRGGMDKYAVNVQVDDTTQDVTLLVGNRWSANQTAYNYDKLQIHYEQSVKSIAVEASSENANHAVYHAIVNGIDNLETQTANWYINDEPQEEHSLTLDTTYQKGGRYEVYVELEGVISNTIISEIAVTDEEVVFWYGLLALTLLAFGLMLWYRGAFKGKKLDGVMEKSLQQFLRELDDLQLKMQNRKMTPQKVFSHLSRQSSTLLLTQDRLMARYQETTIQSYRDSAAALKEISQNLKYSSRQNRTDVTLAGAMIETFRQDIQTAIKELREAENNK